MDTFFDCSDEPTEALLENEARSREHCRLVVSLIAGWLTDPSCRPKIRACMHKMVDECDDDFFHMLLEGFKLQGELNLKKVQAELKRRSS